MVRMLFSFILSNLFQIIQQLYEVKIHALIFYLNHLIKDILLKFLDITFRFHHFQIQVLTTLHNFFHVEND